MEIAIVAGFLVLLGGMLWSVGRLSSVFGAAAESKRKIVHVGLGLSVLALPLLFDRTLPVVVLCLLSLVLLLATRRFKAIGSALHDVGRTSYGDIWFAVSVAVLFLLSDTGQRVGSVSIAIDASPYLFFAVPILIMTLADTAAALTGTAYGRRLFSVEKGQKSWEGATAFFVIAWMAALFVLLLATDIPKDTAILISMTLAFVGATIEAESWGGLDNLFVPMGLHMLLVALAGADNSETLAAFAIYAVLTLLSLRFAGTYGRQPLRAATLVLTVTWIAFGFEDFVMVAVAMAMTLAANRMRSVPDPKADLQTVFAVVVLAVLWIVLGSLLARDMILEFSTSLAVYGATMATIALRTDRRMAAGAVATIAAILFWRILHHGVPVQTGVLRILVGGVGLTLVGLLGMLRPRTFGRHRVPKALAAASIVSLSSMWVG